MIPEAINIGFLIICQEGHMVFIVEFDLLFFGPKYVQNVSSCYNTVTWIQDNIYEMVHLLISHSSTSKLSCCLFNKVYLFP